MSAEHKLPGEGSNCACCWDDLTVENYVEYKSDADSAWMPSLFCENCVSHLINTQWEIYTKALATTNCKAEQRRLLTRGPPINISDPNALPCPDNSEVFLLWFSSDKQEHSAKLAGSLVGEERQKYWDEQSAFYIKDEPDEEEQKLNEMKSDVEAK